MEKVKEVMPMVEGLAWTETIGVKKERIEEIIKNMEDAYVDMIVDSCINYGGVPKHFPIMLASQWTETPAEFAILLLYVQHKVVAAREWVFVLSSIMRGMPREEARELARQAMAETKKGQ